MYADTITASMKSAMGETERRRARQRAYNEEHGITPESVVREIDDVLSSVYERDYASGPPSKASRRFTTMAEVEAEVTRLQGEMRAAAANLDFERAATLRDELKVLKAQEMGLDEPPAGPMA
jgi:excinuclease ABC subunit B